jgi:hypothetical protein
MVCRIGASGTVKANQSRVKVKELDIDDIESINVLE